MMKEGSNLGKGEAGGVEVEERTAPDVSRCGLSTAVRHSLPRVPAAAVQTAVCLCSLLKHSPLARFSLPLPVTWFFYPGENLVFLTFSYANKFMEGFSFHCSNKSLLHLHVILKPKPILKTF